MAVTHLATKFVEILYIQSGDIEIFRNSIWRRPPSWIFYQAHRERGVAGASAPGPGVLRGPGGPPQQKI